MNAPNSPAQTESKTTSRMPRWTNGYCRGESTPDTHGTLHRNGNHSQTRHGAFAVRAPLFERLGVS